MARTPPQYAQLIDEPTIIVDPSLYLDPPRTALGVLRDVSFQIARAIIVSALAGATVFSVAHVLKHQTLTHGLHAPRLDEVVVRVNAARAELMGERSEIALASAVEPQAPRPEPRAHKLEPQVYAAAPKVVSSAAPDRPASEEPSTMAQADSAVKNEELLARVRDGRRYVVQKRYEEAEAAFREVLAKRPRHPGALAGLARVSLVRGNLDEALSLAERAVQAAPYQAAYHVVLGDVLRASGNSLAAQTEYDLAQQLKPERKFDAAERALPPNPFQ